MTENETATSTTAAPQYPTMSADALPTSDDTLTNASATISKDPDTGLWKVDQNPLVIPVDFNGIIEWQIVDPQGTFPANAPILFDFVADLPGTPPVHPVHATLCRMDWSNNLPAFQQHQFTYYAFVQEGGSTGPVFRVDPTVQNQPPG